MAGQDYATVQGGKVHRSDFAYAPPGSEPSEWKLPIHDENHVRDALARFDQTELPAAAKAAARQKVVERAHKYGIDTSGFEKEHSQGSGWGVRDSGNGTRNSDARTPNSEPRTPIVVLLTNEGTAVDTPANVTLHRLGTQLREIAVAVPGSWVKGDHTFTIKKDDLTDMVRNFEKRKNDMLVIDYEHASEQPEVARGGPVPGAGWIHLLRLEAGDVGLGKPQPSSLKALVEWTPQAEEMLRTGQYRFFSPAIDWGARDKKTGEPQGATLTSGALTNHPFLEELPPIMLSDGTVITRSADPFFGSAASRKTADANTAAALRIDGRKSKGVVNMAEQNTEERTGRSDCATEALTEKDGKGHPLPMLKVRKGHAGSAHEGHHVFSDGDQDVGCMSDEGLRKHLGVNPDAERAEKASEVTRLILSEVAKDGKLNNQRASELAAESKITLAAYIRAQEAEKLIDGAIQAGKILPKDRKFFFRDALERPAEFAEYVKGAVPPSGMKLGVHGIGEAETMSPDQEVTALTKKLIEEKMLQYPAALKQVLSENAGLAERYRAAHSSRVNADGTAN